MDSIQSIPDDFQKYWELTKSVWQNGIYGVDIGSILVALIIFGVFFFLRGLFTRFALGAAVRWSARATRRGAAPCSSGTWAPAAMRCWIAAGC